MASIINASTSAGLITTADTSGVLQLQTGGTDAVTVDASQNVGIGTASPAFRLDVAGNVRARLGNFIGPSGTGGFALLGTSAGVTNSGTVVCRDNASTFNPSGVEFYTSNTERMRIDSSGNVLVNNTNASFANSNSFILSAVNGDFVVQHNNTRPSGSAYVWFTYNANPIGSITQNGTTAVSYNTSSDYRLKENIEPMTGALETVALLKPVTYTWKSDGSNGQGFIAHELAEVVPDAVTGEKDAVNEDGSIKPQGIDTSFLVATLTAAIQELKAIIDTQAERIAVLENK